jgi:CheY-like chemotaxis protein
MDMKNIGKTCLVVDDNHDNLMAMEYFLPVYFGMEAVCLDSGHKALEYLSQHKPDVILMDWKMPGLDGVETLDEMNRRMPSHPPVILCTAMSEKSEIEGAIQHGFDGLLLKPFDEISLEACFATALKH